MKSLRPSPLTTTALALLLAQGLAGCQALSNTFGANKVDYRAKAQPAAALDVPPDLTQLASDPRYQPPTGAPVSANALQGAAQSVNAGSRPAPTVAPAGTPELRIERVGNQRWLVSQQTPEQLWPQLQDFWRANGYTLTQDQPKLGLMETDWQENRAKLPQDGLNRLLNRVFDGLTDSGERDRYRMLVERGALGTEITITHTGASQVVVAAATGSSDQVRWQSRPSDPSMEAEMLARLMVALSPAASATSSTAAVTEAGKAVATAPSSPPRARIDGPAGSTTLQLDDGFDRAWRRVGLALDRGGFTVEDRDRSQGTYFVRYIDPKLAGAEQPNFLARLFGKDKPDATGRRYRVKVAAQGNSASTVAVLEAEGTAAPTGDESTRNIAQLLLNELR